ncbi:MAG TPA: hypothetical protein VFB42_13065 [Gaiellaceae bacterium]|nr:hypothetical protein [Gaiellaceae bacterium]
MKLGAGALLGVAREVRAGAGDRRPLAVAGARELVPLLAKALREGGDPSAVREGGPPEGAAALVWLGKADGDVLRRASLAHVPIVGVTEGESLPYVLDTDLVVVRPGEALPVERVARRLAAALGDRGTALAARLPLLRGPVVDVLVETCARRNALVAAAVFAPGVDLPVLTLNQVRLVLRIALAHGREVDRERLPEVLAVVGAGFGLRAVARELLALVPGAGLAAKAAVAYAGTRALGEAARRRFPAESVRSGS